jgi:hypothetical protein
MKILKKGGVVEKRGGGEEETKSMPHAPVLTTRHLIVFFVRDFRVFKYKGFINNTLYHMCYM